MQGPIDLAILIVAKEIDRFAPRLYESSCVKLDYAILGKKSTIPWDIYQGSSTLSDYDGDVTMAQNPLQSVEAYPIISSMIPSQHILSDAIMIPHGYNYRRSHHHVVSPRAQNIYCYCYMFSESILFCPAAFSSFFLLPLTLSLALLRIPLAWDVFCFIFIYTKCYFACVLIAPSFLIWPNNIQLRASRTTMLSRTMASSETCTLVLWSAKPEAWISCAGLSSTPPPSFVA